MSIEELEDQVENLLQEIETLEDKCDTLPICEEDDGCERCESYKKIEELSAKVEEIEDKIEKLMGEEED
jgi:predicted RNase H-like nuclease (RuvC/YqgF family)